MTMKQRREHARQRELKNAVEFYKENKVQQSPQIKFEVVL